MGIIEESTSVLDDLPATGLDPNDTAVIDPLGALKKDIGTIEDADLLLLLQRREAEGSAAQESVKVIRSEIERRLTEAADLETDRLLKDPMTFADLLRDRSRQKDGEFAPSDEQKERLLKSANTEVYDASALHDGSVHSEETLLREQNTALVQYDGDSTFTLHIPDGSEASSGVRIVTFTIPETTKVESFAALLGSAIRVDAELGDNTLGEAVKRGGGFDSFSAIVPLALQRVEVGGKQQYRLPDVVWNEFGRYAVTT